jgi:hypothetical protein
MGTWNSRLRRRRGDLVARLRIAGGRLEWKAGIFFLAVTVPIVANWYRGATYVGGSDDGFPFGLKTIERYSQLVGTPLVAPDARKLPFLLPWGLVLDAWRVMGVPWSGHLAQLSMNVALMALAGLGGFKLTCWALPSVHRAGAVVGGLVYELNLFAAIAIWNEQSLLVFHYALFPWAWLAWDRALKSSSASTVARAAAIWVICLGPSYVTTPSVVTDVALFGALVVWHIATQKEQRRKCAVAALSVVVWVLLCSLFWLVPLVHYFGSEYAAGMSAGSLRGLLTLNSVPLSGAIRFGGYWGLTSGYAGSPYYPWARGYLSWAYSVGYAIPALALVGLLTADRVPRMSRESGRHGTRGGAAGQAGDDVFKERAEVGVGPDCLDRPKGAFRTSAGVPGTVLILAIVAEVSILMATGGEFPLGATKLWLLTTSHLAAEFRSVYQRFETYAPLGMAPLAGIGTSWLLRWAAGSRRTGVVGRRRRRRYLRALPWPTNVARRAWTAAVFAGIVMMTVGIPAYPMIVGSIFDQSGVFPAGRVVVPRSYIQLGNWLSRVDRNQEAVLTLPLSQTGLTVLSWARGSQGYYGTQPLELLTDLPVIDGAAAGSLVPDVLGELERGSVSGCRDIRALDVGYIVLEDDAAWPFIESEGGWVGASRHSVEAALGSAPASTCLVRGRRFGPVLTWRVVGHIVSPVSWERSCSSTSSAARYMLSGQTADAQALGNGGWSVLGSPPVWAHCLVLAIPFDSAWSMEGRRARDVGGLTGFTLAGVRLRPGHALVLTSAIEATSRWLLWLGIIVLILAVLVGYAATKLSHGWSSIYSRRQRSE